MILVTGGAGFIGSHISERLQKRGVRILDNLSGGSLDNIRNLRVQFIKGDINDKKKVEEVMKGVRTVLHLAANVTIAKSIKNPVFDVKSNIIGTLNLLEAARKNDVEQFIFSSSSSIYGDTKRTTIKEDTLPCPKSPYGVGKLACEHYVRIYHELYGLKTISLRYFNVYGRRQNPKSPYAAVVAKFLYNAKRGVPLEIHGDGLQRRDFIHVRDVARANELALKSRRWGVSLNIGTGKSISILNLARIILKMRDVGMIYKKARGGDIRSSIADVRLSRKILRFKAHVSLGNSLAELWKVEW